MNKTILYSILILLLTSCFLDSGSDDSKDVVTTDELTLDSSVTTPTPTYLLLTNYGNSLSKVPDVTVKGGSRSLSLDYKSDNSLTFIDLKQKRSFHPSSSNSITRSRTTSGPISDQYTGLLPGESRAFSVLGSFDSNGNPIMVDKPFMLKSRDQIDPAFDSNLELLIWSDSAVTISQEQIDFIKNKFIGSEGIYSDMNRIFGSHWGSITSQSENISWLSPTNSDIHILLTDIENDQNSSDSGFIAGYFSSDDTTGSVSSNRALALVIDSYDYLNPKLNNSPISWSGSNYQSASLISTIIHEHQHLINFYQKGVKMALYGEYFFNEMFSMTAEDILAKKHLGFTLSGRSLIFTPDIERLSTFNLFWDRNSSFYWDNYTDPLNSYSVSYTLGAYLVRNYGIEMFKKYLELPGQGIDTLLSTLNTLDGSSNTVTTLLQNFGTAVLQSKRTDQNKPYQFNSPSPIVKSGYQLKPLNLFNNYQYYFQGYEENRLFNGTNSLQRGINNAPFRSMTLGEIEEIREEELFLAQSNIYIYLGLLDKDSEITIDHYDEFTTSRLVY